MPRTSFSHYATCNGCARPVWWPLWRYVGDARYIPLCPDCRRYQEETFTPEQAVMQAIIIVGIRQGILNAVGGAKR